MKKLLLTFITIITTMLPISAMDNYQQEELNAKLLSALQGGTNEKVTRCLEKGANPNACYENGESALIRAIYFLHQVDLWVQMNSLTMKTEKKPEQRIKRLLDAGADVNARTVDGATALILATGLMTITPDNTGKYNYQPAITLLLEKSPDINAQDNDGYTALMLAALNGRIEICRQLIDAGADIHTLDHEGATIFMHAARTDENDKNKQAICELLIERQQEINTRIITALMCFHRLKNDGNPVGKLFYTQRKFLLLPYLGPRKYASLKKLLSLKPEETGGKTAYEMCGIECLNPEKYI